jgi:hypothetical protein
MRNIIWLLLVFGEAARTRGSWKSICSMRTCITCERIIWTHLDNPLTGLYKQVNLCNRLFRLTSCCDSVMRKDHFANGDFGSVQKPSCCTEQICDPSTIIRPSNFLIPEDEDPNLIDYQSNDMLDQLTTCK